MRKRFRKRAGIEPVIGHLKSDHRLDRNYLKGFEGDQINVMMATAAFNSRKWMRLFLLTSNITSIWDRITRYIANPIHRGDPWWSTESFSGSTKKSPAPLVKIVFPWCCNSLRFLSISRPISGRRIVSLTCIARYRVR